MSVIAQYTPAKPRACYDLWSGLIHRDMLGDSGVRLGRQKTRGGAFKPLLKAFRLTGSTFSKSRGVRDSKGGLKVSSCVRRNDGTAKNARLSPVGGGK